MQAVGRFFLVPVRPFRDCHLQEIGNSVFVLIDKHIARVCVVYLRVKQYKIAVNAVGVVLLGLDVPGQLVVVKSVYRVYHTRRQVFAVGGKGLSRAVDRDVRQEKVRVVKSIVMAEPRVD